MALNEENSRYIKKPHAGVEEPVVIALINSLMSRCST